MSRQKPSGRLPKAVYETHAAFRFALRQFYRFAETMARSVGLTPQQYQGLLAIYGFPGRDYVTVGELAERLQIHHHSAVGLANRLVRNGLVVRTPAPLDRRHVFLKLTPKGMDLLRRVSSANRGELRRRGQEMTRLLRRLLQFSADH